MANRKHSISRRTPKFKHTRLCPACGRILPAEEFGANRVSCTRCWLASKGTA